jgi:uroporphyrinogen decarboxylase
MMMTLRERVEGAFDFQEVRPTPYTVWYESEIKEKLDRYYGCEDWQSRISNYILRVTIDWRPRRYMTDREFLDVHGSRWQLGDPEHLLEPALSEPRLNGFTIPSYIPFLLQPESGDRTPEQPRERNGRAQLRFEEARALFASQGKSYYTVVDFGYGLFESAWMIRGFQGLLMDVILEPAFVHDLLDRLLERHLEILDVLAGLPCDAIMIVDDYGDQRGVPIGPDRWRTFIKPRLAKLYERIHAAGKKTFHHSCGNIFPIIPDLLDIGLDVLQSVQPEAMPVYEIKRLFGKSLRLWGAFGTQSLLPFGTPEQIRAEARRLKQELGREGGYVFTSSKPILREVPVENAAALIEESIAEDC